MAKPFLTATEVAEMLQMNVETIYALIAMNDLPAARVGGRWRFDEDKLRDWIAANSVNEQADSVSDVAIDQ